MILMLCVEDGMGLSFGGKRQSRDREVTRDIITSAAGSILWTDEYSGKLLLEDASLFSEQTVAADAIRVDTDCLTKAGVGEYCFVEIADVSACAEKAERIILYHWNRAYPSTAKFALPDGFALRASEEFPGNSHEKIIKEEYTR